MFCSLTVFFFDFEHSVRLILKQKKFIFDTTKIYVCGFFLLKKNFE